MSYSSVPDCGSGASSVWLTGYFPLKDQALISWYAEKSGHCMEACYLLFHPNSQQRGYGLFSNQAADLFFYH